MSGHHHYSPRPHNNNITSGFAYPSVRLVAILLLHFSVQLLSFDKALSVSIDNNIIGEPDIECLDREIRVWVKTRKFFGGRIFAKGKSEDPECSKVDFSTKRTKKPHFDLPLGMCGMKSLRSFDPRGMYYGITLVISFHTLFITKVDQAFHVKCFFEEANRGLTAELGVSMIPTTEVEARHGIPGCTYSIHRSSILDLDAGKPAGTPIQFAKVGDKVLHQWHCDDQMFGILINNCYVTDGVNKRAQVIDSHGCPIDPILITGIRYSSDLQRAYAESQVFKFADRPGVWFFCQIQMCMKKDGMCDGITPPGCATTSRPPLTGGSTGGGRTVFTRPRGRIGSGGATGVGGGEDGDEDNGGDYDAATDASSSQPDDDTTDLAVSGRPTRIGPRKPIPKDYEEESAANTDIGNASDLDAIGGVGGLKSGGGSSTLGRPRRPSLTRPPSPRHHNAVDSLDGEDASLSGAYDPSASSAGGGAQLPSAIEYEANEDARESATVFAPAFSAAQLARGGNAAEKDDSGGGILDPVASYVANRDAPVTTAAGRQELTAEFETHDDLRPRGVGGLRTTTSIPRQQSRGGAGPPSGPKKDYVNYEDGGLEAQPTDDGDGGELSPKLAGLLANLPDEINAQSLQKMFRDSVADRRALLNDFDLLLNKIKKEDEKPGSKQRPTTTTTRKPPPQSLAQPPLASGIRQSPQKSSSIMLPGARIDTMHVSWDDQQHLQQSHRMARDLPLSTAGDAPTTSSTRSGSASSAKMSLPTISIGPNITVGGGPDDPPMIAGQLLIYDLDETPPDELINEGEVGGKRSLSGGSVSTRRALPSDDGAADGDCGLSRQGLFLVTASFSSLVAALVVVVVALFVKLHYFHSKMGGTEKRKTAATSLTGRQNAKATASRSVETSSRTNNAGGDEEVEVDLASLTSMASGGSPLTLASSPPLLSASSNSSSSSSRGGDSSGRLILATTKADGGLAAGQRGPHHHALTTDNNKNSNGNQRRRANGSIFHHNNE